MATVLHPVFFTSNATRSIEVGYDPATGECKVVRAKVIKEYLFVPPAMGIAVVGQPAKQVRLMSAKFAQSERYLRVKD